jgi:hypothetical protein
MPLPIVSGSLTQTPIGGVKMNPSSFRQAAMAPGRIASELGKDVSAVFGEVAQKLQANFNFQQTAKADLDMRKAKDDFTAQLVKMPDPGTWLPAWQEKTQGMRDQIINNPRNGPEVKQNLGRMFDIWEQSTTSEIKTQALRKQVADSKESAIADYTYAAHQGDQEGAINTLRAAVENHAMSEADFKKYAARVPTIAAQANADLAIDSDPLNADKVIDKLKGNLDPRTLVSLNAKAREAKSASQRNNSNDWNERFAASPDGTIDMDALNADVKAKKVTQVFANGLIARMDRSKIKESKDGYLMAATEVHDHDWEGDKNPQETGREITDRYAYLQPADTLRLSKELSARMESAKKKGESEERPVVRQIFDQMREDRYQNGYTVPLIEKTKPEVFHLFSANEPAKVEKVGVEGGLNALQSGKFTDEQIESTYGKGVTRDQLIRAEQLHYANITHKMREWFKDPANKDATYEQANDYRIELEKPFVMNQVSAVLKPKTNQFRIGQRVKQNGETYEFDGSNWNPAK